MKKHLVLAVVTLFILSSCNEGSKSNHSNKGTDYIEAKQTIEDIERATPTNYLKGSINSHKNLVGQWVITGTLSNKATTITYKDAILEFRFLTKTHTVLSTSKQSVYEFIAPNQSATFNFKLTAPKEATEVNWSIVQAKAAN